MSDNQKQSNPVGIVILSAALTMLVLASVSYLLLFKIFPLYQVADEVIYFILIRILPITIGFTLVLIALVINPPPTFDRIDEDDTIDVDKFIAPLYVLPIEKDETVVDEIAAASEPIEKEIVAKVITPAVTKAPVVPRPIEPEKIMMGAAVAVTPAPIVPRPIEPEKIMMGAAVAVTPAPIVPRPIEPEKIMMGAAVAVTPAPIVPRPIEPEKIMMGAAVAVTPAPIVPRPIEPEKIMMGAAVAVTPAPIVPRPIEPERIVIGPETTVVVEDGEIYRRLSRSVPFTSYPYPIESTSAVASLLEPVAESSVDTTLDAKYLGVIEDNFENRVKEEFASAKEFNHDLAVSKISFDSEDIYVDKIVESLAGSAFYYKDGTNSIYAIHPFIDYVKADSLYKKMIDSLQLQIGFTSLEGREISLEELLDELKGASDASVVKGSKSVVGFQGALVS
ncbi:MAG: hypothetical protein ACOXZZ_02475 [Sphaerochaetaceae bacterium]